MSETISLTTALIIASAYLLGSIPTAVLVCHSMGIADPRQQGSGNPGATNVLRIGGRSAAVITLIGDIAKGAIAVAIAKWMSLSIPNIGLTSLAVIIGHMFPVHNIKRGGKGVATTLGCGLILSWPLALIQMLCWVVTFLIARISSVAAITTAICTPIICYFLHPELAGIYVLIGLLMLVRHSRNIKHLLNHTEHHF